MKGFIALLVVAFFAATQALTEEEIGKLKAFYEKCTASTGVDKELIVKARKGEFSKDQKLKEYFFCMFNEIGIMNDKGELQVEEARKRVPADVKKEDAEKVIQACKDKKGSDKFDTASQLYECYYTTSPTHITFA